MKLMNKKILPIILVLSFLFVSGVQAANFPGPSSMLPLTMTRDRLTFNELLDNEHVPESPVHIDLSKFWVFLRPLKLISHKSVLCIRYQIRNFAFRGLVINP
jgi:hypothetical protein